MSKLSIDRLQLQIIIDNDQARNELRKLEKSMSDLQKQIRKTPEGSEEWKKLTAELKEQKLAHDKVIQSIGLNGLSLKELSARQKELNAIMRQMDPRLPEYKKLEEQLRLVSARQNELRNATRETQSTFSRLADSFNKYQALAMGIAAAGAAVYLSLQNMLQGSAKFSDALADVRKTTGLTDIEVKQLSRDLKSIDTRSSRQELLELARVAGKLGISGREDILGFVRAADQINVALAEDLGGNTEEAINQIGKLVDVFKVKDQFGLEAGLLKTGSAINALGAASTANEGYLVEFAKRMGGVANQANISIQQVLGLGATLDQLGQTSEISSTALMGLWVNMFKDPAAYAEIAKVSVKDFTTLLKTDANEAFIQLLDGLNGNNDGLTAMAQRLDGLGLDGKRAISVLATLSQNTSLLRDQQKLSNDEFEKGTSLTKEFNVKNETLGATLDKIGKIMASAFISQTLLEGLASIAKGFLNIISASDKVSDSTIRQKDSVNKLVIELTSANTEEERKKRIWEELQQIAPTVLSNIDKENISVSQLAENLRKYNEQMIKKIALQDSEEKLKDVRDEAGNAASERINSEINLQNVLIRNQKFIAQYDKERGDNMQNILLSNIDIIEKSKQINELSKQFNTENSIMSRQAAQDWKQMIQTPSLYVDELLFKKEKEAIAKQKVNSALEAYTARYKILMADQPPTPAPTPGLLTQDGSETGTPLTEKELKALEKSAEDKKKIQEDYYDSISKLADESFKNSLSKDQQELLAIDEKYQALYAKADLAGASTTELQKQHAEELSSKQKEIEERTQKEILELKQKYGVDVSDELMAFELAQLTQLYDQKLISEEQFQIARQNIIQKYNKDEEKTAKLAAKNEVQIEKWKSQGKMAIIQSTSDLVQTVFKSDSLAAKIAASAMALVNTWAAAAAALAPPPLGMGPVYGIPFATAAVISGLANVAKINAVQFASGKYDVIGASDGQTYRANYVPTAKSGLYTEPTLIGGLGLVAEKAPELVFDGLHTRAIINTPGLVEALMTIRAPQFSSGNYPTAQSTPVIVNQQAPADFSLIQILLKEISEKLDKPTRAAIVYSDLDNAINEVETIKKSVSK